MILQNPSKETETGGAAKPMKDTDNTTASTANNEQKGINLSEDMDDCLELLGSADFDQSLELCSLSGQSIDKEIDEFLKSIEEITNNTTENVPTIENIGSIEKVEFKRTLKFHDNRNIKKTRFNNNSPFTDASTQVEVEPEEGKKVATVAPIASTPWITVQLGRAVDPRWLWTQTCPWGRSPNPPTDFYSQGQDPLGSLKNKIHYVPLGTIVSMYDQDHIRSEILEQWQPRKGVRVDQFILWLRDHIRVQVQGMFGLINENRQDHWVRRLLQVHWKVAKEDVRLAVKIRYRGALHELEAMLARTRQPTWQEVDLVTKLLWWPSNIRHE